ncbi:hypothetical protein [Streptomyces sp. NBC_01565]|uniref:hypothetical protein n=1 Tax=unclassified Streptomyces TaxID=2593676 RepID=UPI0022571B3B|nr:hypothetical protein [Streptomyces sp. NBC_01565]MCX4539364.1 hypothetical protein [Streptomyces sp. NBC_01565]
MDRETRRTKGVAVKGGMEEKRQEPGIGREEQVRDTPGQDPVHPEASRPVPGKTPADLRRQQERRMRRDHESH